jgi:WD40 repeat protein
VSAVAATFAGTLASRTTTTLSENAWFVASLVLALIAFAVLLVAGAPDLVGWPRERKSELAVKRSVTRPTVSHKALSPPAGSTLSPLSAPRRAEPSYWATVREIHQRVAMLAGRDEALADLTSFATRAGGYRWLTGRAWAGKTALLAEVVTALQGEADVVSYFLSRREGDADSSRFLAAVVPQLAYLLDDDFQDAELSEFRALWQRAADRADAEGRHLLLVVDGLDEDLRSPGLPSVSALLPGKVGGRAHVLVSSRLQWEVPSDMPPGHLLVDTQPVELEPFTGAHQLSELARQEIDDLTRREDGLAADVLGLLTAAAGPLAIEDLEAMTVVAPPSAALKRRIRKLVTVAAARSLQAVGPTGSRRYQFAHDSLLEHAQANDDLNDPDFRGRIHQWAQGWCAAGWQPAADREMETPRYLLDTYPSTLTRDPRRLAALVGDAGWVEAAIRSVGVDRVLADLRRAAADERATDVVAAMLAAVSGQAHHLRPPQPVSQPGYVLRQICLHAAELADDRLAEDARTRLQALNGPGLVPLWTTRRVDRALSAELGQHDAEVQALAVLPDGRVVSAAAQGMRVWEPAAPGANPVELGHHDGAVRALAVLPDGRVAAGGDDGLVRVWDPAAPGANPVELGHHDGAVRALAVLPDGRVAAGGDDGLVRVWDPAAPGANPVELGHHDGAVRALAVLPDGRVVSAAGARVRVWDAAAPRVESLKFGHLGIGVCAVAVLPDGRIVSAEAAGTQRMRLWDAAHAEAAPLELGRRQRYGVHAVAVLSDGRVASGGGDGRVRLWDPVRAGVTSEQGGHHDGWLRAVGVLPDGRVISAESREVQIWDPAQPEAEPVEIGSEFPWVEAVAVLPDGRVVSGGGYGIHVWETERPPSHKPTYMRQYISVKSLATLPDGRVISGGVEGAHVWGYESYEPEGQFQWGLHLVELGHLDGVVCAVAVLPDGRVVAALGRALTVLDGQIVRGAAQGMRVWDPAAPDASLVELGHHDAAVQALAVLPDGRIVSGEDDGRVRVWDPVAPGASPVELGHHDGQVRVLAALPDGRVASGGSEYVMVWDVSAQAEVTRQPCPVVAFATAPHTAEGECQLVMAHEGGGISAWLIRSRQAQQLPLSTDSTAHDL